MLNKHCLFYRTFQLRLERDTSTFLPDAESVEADGSTKPLDVSHIYKGILEGLFSFIDGMLKYAQLTSAITVCKILVYWNMY